MREFRDNHTSDLSLSDEEERMLEKKHKKGKRKRDKKPKNQNDISTMFNQQLKKKVSKPAEPVAPTETDAQLLGSIFSNIDSEAVQQDKQNAVKKMVQDNFFSRSSAFSSLKFSQNVQFSYFSHRAYQKKITM